MKDLIEKLPGNLILNRSTLISLLLSILGRFTYSVSQRPIHNEKKIREYMHNNKRYEYGKMIFLNTFLNIRKIKISSWTTDK